MSCQYPLNIAPYQDAVNNTLLPDIGNTPLAPNSSTTGTFNNMTFVGGINFSGSDGNTTTDGYYITYNGSILNLKNIMNFTIDFPSSTYCLQLGRNQQFPFTTSTTYNYTYFSNISSSIKINTNSCGYIPQTSTKIYGPCCNDPLKSCFYDWSCYTTSTVPSSYACCAVCVPASYDGTITTKPNPDDITLSYVTGNTLPSGYTIVGSYTVNLPAGFTSRLNTLYFYNFNVTEMNVNIGSVSISGIPTPPGGWNVSDFNSEFNSLVTQYLVPFLNTLVNNQAFEFRFVYSN
jgi:hypothetical protein